MAVVVLFGKYSRTEIVLSIHLPQIWTIYFVQ